MAKGKKHTPEQIVSLLRQIEVAVANGKPDFSSCGIPDPNKKVFVYVEMDVNTKGVPEAVSLSRRPGNACVDRIALASAKKLRYLPPTRDGKPAVVHTMIKAEF